MSNITSVLLLLLIASSASGEANQLTARDGGWGSSLSGHSFFDIALTALAFLSFGIFLLNLLLNALLFTSGLQTGLTSTGPIITMTAPTATGGATATAGVSTGAQAVGYRRNKRSIDETDAMFSIPSNVAAEVLATSALKSLKMLLNEDESNRHCLPHAMCEGVRQGTVIGKGFQYLMPLYTISSSYIGERLGLHSSLPTHLDAILVGFGGRIPCTSVFPRCPSEKTAVPNSPSSYHSATDEDNRSNSG